MPHSDPPLAQEAGEAEAQASLGVDAPQCGAMDRADCDVCPAYFPALCAVEPHVGSLAGAVVGQRGRDNGLLQPAVTADA